MKNNNGIEYWAEIKSKIDLLINSREGKTSTDEYIEPEFISYEFSCEEPNISEDNIITLNVNIEKDPENIIFYSPIANSAARYGLKTKLKIHALPKYEETVRNLLLLKKFAVYKNNICNYEDYYPIFNISADMNDNNCYKKLYCTSSKKPLAEHEEIYIEPNECIDEILNKIARANILDCIKCIKTNAEKESAEEDLKKFFDENKMTEVPVIAFYIWSIILRRLFKENFNDAINKVECICNNVLDDAMIYANGIYQLAENACLHSAGKRGWLYINIIADEVRTIKKGSLYIPGTSTAPSNPDSETKQHYLKVLFVDDAFDKTGTVGIVEHYNRNNKSNINIKCLSEMFERKPFNDCDLTEHNGLRVFKRMVEISNGEFCVYSPKSENTAEYYVISPNVDKSQNQNETINFYSGTIYTISIPFFQNNNKHNSIALSSSTYAFDMNNICKTYDIIYKTPDIKSEYQSVSEKQEYIKTLFSQLRERGDTKRNSTEEEILFISCKGRDIESLELLAKAIMLYVIHCHNECNKIAILMANQTQVMVFAEFFTAFFDDNGRAYEAFDAQNTQIALCTQKNSDAPEICFIISCTDINSINISARSYYYHNRNTSITYLHLISRITSFISKKGTENLEKGNQIELFPFDLYMTSEQSQNDKTKLINSWFNKSIDKILDTPMHEGYGCKIENIHISMGSKIHIDTFYNAELLFHNNANVWRFAYLTAREIMLEHRNLSDKKIMLIAYEEYSLLLIQYIKDIITRNFKNEVSYTVYPAPKDLKTKAENTRHSIFANSGYSDSKEHWDDFANIIEELKKKAEKNHEDKVLDDYVFYIILPIATTLTTIRKIRASVKRVCADMNINCDVNYGKSITLIVVCGKDSENKSYGEAFGYWESFNEKNRTIILKGPDNRQEEKEKIEVGYYFNPKCNWYKPYTENSNSSDDPAKYECIMCMTDKTNECKINEGTNKKAVPRCLIGVDRSSLFPSAILENSRADKGTFKDHRLPDFNSSLKEEHLEKEECYKRLYGNIIYSHVCDSNNHFQYDINYRNFINDEKINPDIIRWLKYCVRPEIKSNAFNIIVSPLDIINSDFLKLVIDNAFEGNIRLFNIKINSSFRDEVRAKFNYIAEEYKKMKRTVGDIKINVYYVDDCIIGASSLHRGRQFMHMLLTKSLSDLEQVSLFEGIIVLLNRSSYDTIQNLIPGRIEKFFYYLRLNVPSFNTRNGNCPACGLADQYMLMHKRSSTKMIADEYFRLYNKHRAKTEIEYSDWLDKEIEKGKYDKWYDLWCYYAVCKKVDEKKKNVDFAFKDIRGVEHNIADICGAYAEYIINNFSLKMQTNNSSEEYRRKEKEIKAVVIKKCILADRNFSRMYCTHQTFMKTEDIYEEMQKKGMQIDGTDAKELARDKILELFKEKLDDITNITSGDENLKIQLWLKGEWIISYIKIITRNQPAKYYLTREVAYNILLDIADSLITENKDDKEKLYTPPKDIEFLVNLIKISPDDNSDNSIMPDMKYNIFLTIIRRLSAMHSNYIINNIEKIFAYYEKCANQYNAVGVYSRFYTASCDRNVYKKLIQLPSESSFIFSITKLIKWSSISGYDESKCYVVDNEANKYRDPDKQKNKSDLIEKVMKVVVLENTQIIYSGIKLLADEYRKDDSLVLNEIKEYVEEKYSSALCENSEMKFYELNPHKMFFSFMEMQETFKNDHIGRYYTYANMIKMFKALRKLENMDSGIKDPYIYEDICGCMRNITGYDQCHIISRKDNRIMYIASSNIFVKYIDKDMGKNRINSILKEYEDNADKDVTLNSDIQKYCIEGSDNPTEVMVLGLPISGKNVSKVYILLYKGDIPKDDICSHKTEDYICSHKTDVSFEDIYRARNILFVRDMLEEMLRRDIVSLHDMAHSYEYVKNIRGKERPLILHISDLHVTSDNAENIISKIEQSDSLKNLNTPDLILITGDVITGKYNASGMTVAYKAAAQVIKAIVKKLWTIEKNDLNGTECYVIRDWQKRIIISPGNHDYASMNELEATNKSRVTTAGTPGDMGDIMIKHSYFINFIHKLLGTDIDELVKNDLNRIINYDTLKITVANINTNSNVNPLRTNKVGINGDELKKIFDQNKICPTIIYMMHHTPMYTLDYVDDIYYLRNNMVYSDLKNKVKGYISNVCWSEKELNKLWIDLIKSIASESNTNKLDKDKVELIKTVTDSTLKNDKKTYDELDMSDIAYLCSCKDIKCDDRCQKLIFLIKERVNASKNDTDKYREVIATHLQELEKQKADLEKIYILGGHTHTAAEYKDYTRNEFEFCKGIYEADRFYRDKEKLNYGVLNLEAENYTFEGNKALNKAAKSTIMDKLIYPDKK